jgi:GT2 family glycosyltransferase
VDKSVELSVVICAYTEQRWDDLVAAVMAVKQQCQANDEVIVVIDQNSALLERVKTSLPAVQAIINQEARGLGGARNSGTAAAQGAIVVFLDDDAVPAPTWLEQVRNSYTDPNIWGVGGGIEPAWQGQPPRWFPAEFYWVVGCSYRGMPAGPAPVRNLLGCNMSFRREILTALGGFRLGYGCDETEFCIRVHQRWPDKVLLYNPQAKVHHKVPTNRARWRYFSTRCYFEGRSKAVVAWLVGKQAGLASERLYALQTLPKGVARAIADTLLRGDPSGLERTLAIVAGLAITTAGYLSGSATVMEAARERGWSPQPQQKAV